MSTKTRVVLELGITILKSVLLSGLKNIPIVSDATSSIIDIVKAYVLDEIEQNKLNNLFNELGLKIGENIYEIFEKEGDQIEEQRKDYIANKVNMIIKETKISSKLLVDCNLDPMQLQKLLLATSTEVTKDFSGMEKEFYRRVIAESSKEIIEMADRLAGFTINNFAAILKWQADISKKIDQVLENARNSRERQMDSRTEASNFERDYLWIIDRYLDRLNIFGVDDNTPERQRHKLTTAYVTLEVERKIPSIVRRVSNDQKNEPEGDNVAMTRFMLDDALLLSPRLVIQGSPGSGKTTLLQWIAVCAAGGKFQGKLLGWNKIIPFYIRLRRFATTDLPSSDEFPRLIDPHTPPPSGWVDTQLRSGHAVVLIDGLDEVPEKHRKQVFSWLKDLISRFPNTRYIITTRPHVISKEELEQEGFLHLEVQPMGRNDIEAFIDHWHSAVEEVLQNENRPIEDIKFSVEKLRKDAEKLKRDLDCTPSTRRLATNPLLCAMLCALNQKLETNIPTNRRTLYDECCKLFLSRDQVRDISQKGYVSLNEDQKKMLLKDFAYWLMQNGLTGVKKSNAEAHFGTRIIGNKNIRPGTNGKEICRLFVERTGMIQEASPNWIDFAHRTFQEHFTSLEVLDREEIEKLLEKAEDDQWREVIILASGNAPRFIREKIINGLITLGNRKPEVKERKKLYLLAMSCLETSEDIDKKITHALRKRLDDVVPPGNLEDAKSLATLGEIAIPSLKNSTLYSPTVSCACIRTLALIGTDPALEMLESYPSDDRPEVTEELIRTWDSFDREVYGRQIIPLIRKVSLLSLERLKYFTGLVSLNLKLSQPYDLKPLAMLTKLTSLELTLPEPCDLKTLSKLVKLIHLKIRYLSRPTDVLDKTSLLNLVQLKSLDLLNANIQDLSFLTYFPHLAALDLSGSHIKYQTFPNNLTQLRSLTVEGDRDLNFLIHFPQLTMLDLSGSHIEYQTFPNNLTQLRSLTLGSSRDLNFLTPLSRLEILDLTRANLKNVDLKPLTRFKNLKTIIISDASIHVPEDLKGSIKYLSKNK